MPKHHLRSSILSADEERILFSRITRGDREARDQMILLMRPLARSIARGYARSPEHLAELEQVAAVGLIKAVDRFDLSVGTRFSSYAFPTVAGEIRRHLRDTSWSVHVPRDLRDLAWRLPGIEHNLAATLRRAPRESEVAVALGCDAEQLAEARLALGGYGTSPIDSATGQIAAAGARGGDDPEFARCEERLTVRSALRALPASERTIVELRFDEDLSQSQISERLGCSQMQVSRVLAQAFGRLAELAGDERRAA